MGRGQGELGQIIRDPRHRDGDGTRSWGLQWSLRKLPPLRSWSAVGDLEVTGR